MIILTTTYNCEKYVERCLYSIMSQSYKDFKCFITDDLSTDSTTDIIEEIIKTDNRFILIKNKEKMYQPGNYDQIIRGLNINDNEICVEVDGDDWLPNSNVFLFINNVYKDENVWMTSGSFKYCFVWFDWPLFLLTCLLINFSHHTTSIKPTNYIL